jgi:hypothetical protein
MLKTPPNPAIPLVDKVGVALASFAGFLQAVYKELNGAPLGTIYRNSGTPASHTELDGAVIGALYLRIDGGASTTLYVKEAAGGVGWAAK